MKLKLILAALSAGVLVACGGGGGGGAGDAPVAPQAWQTAQFLENSNAEAFDANVAINADGVGYAVWKQFEGTSTVAFARSYRNGIWGPAEKISGADPVIVSAPKVVVLPDGEALAVWQETSVAPGTEGVKFNRTQGGVWLPQTGPVQVGVGNVEDLVLRANAQGAAMAVWNQQTTLANTPSIHGAAFRNGAFELVQEISFGTSGTDSPDIAIDAAGNVLAAWSQLNGNTNSTQIFVRAYVEGVWTADRGLNLTDTVNSSAPRVAVGANGAASVVWKRGDGAIGTSVEITRATNFAQNEWDGVVSGLNANPGQVFSPLVTLDSAGVTNVIWVEDDGGVLSLVSGQQLLTGNNLQKVETDDAGDVALPAVAVDASGRVMAVWQQNDGTGRNRMLSNRLDPATGKWGVPELIERETTGSANAVSLAMNPAGRAIAVWEQDAGGSNVMANVFK